MVIRFSVGDQERLKLNGQAQTQLSPKESSYVDFQEKEPISSLCSIGL